MTPLFKRIHNEHFLDFNQSILLQLPDDMSDQLWNHVWEETVDVLALGTRNLWDEIHFQLKEDHEAA